MALISLQYLRGIAALLVISDHLPIQLHRMGVDGMVPHWGAGGVDIFFVLSGFLMWQTTAGKSQRPLDFYWRRIARIVPLYWLLTSVAVAVMVVAPHLVQSARFDWLNVIGSYLFFFTPAANGRMEPVLVVGWTLNYEMMFYLVFGAALLLPISLRFVATAGVIGGLSLLGMAGLATTPLEKIYTGSIMLEFVFGMAISVWWRQQRPAGDPAKHSALVATAVLITGFLTLTVVGDWMPAMPRAFGDGVPAVLIVVGALLLERSGKCPQWPTLRWVGDSSYSLYLSHPIALSAFAQLWRKLELHLVPGGPWLFCLAAYLVCLAVGGLTYRWLELPLTRLFGARTGALVRKPAAPVSR